MIYKISTHRQDKRLLILAAFNPDVTSPVAGYDPAFREAHVDALFGAIGGYGFNGYCERKAGAVHFAGFQRAKVEADLNKAGWTAAE